MCKNQFYPICDFYNVIGVGRTLTYLTDRIEMNPKDAKAWMLRGNFHDDSPGESGKALSLDHPAHSGIGSAHTDTPEVGSDTSIP